MDGFYPLQRHRAKSTSSSSNYGLEFVSGYRRVCSWGSSHCKLNELITRNVCWQPNGEMHTNAFMKAGIFIYFSNFLYRIFFLFIFLFIFCDLILSFCTTALPAEYIHVHRIRNDAKISDFFLFIFVLFKICCCLRCVFFLTSFLVFFLLNNVVVLDCIKF